MLNEKAIYTDKPIFDELSLWVRQLKRCRGNLIRRIFSFLLFSELLDSFWVLVLLLLEILVSLLKQILVGSSCHYVI